MRGIPIGAAVGLVSLAHIPVPAQPGPSAADPFVATIAAVKRSVAPLVCLKGEGKNARVTSVEGSSLFISGGGEFITAAHVIHAMADDPTACPIAAIILPTGEWRPDMPEEVLLWFPFAPAACVIEDKVDVARCKPEQDLSDQPVKILPARFEFTPPPDGTQVGFTGFPLSNRDPMTSRAAIATHRNFPHQGTVVAELVLDHVALPGGSGSPVYLSDGRVIGILIARGIGEGAGVAVVRPSGAFRKLLAQP